MKRHRLSLTVEELVALRDRLVPISPTAYDRHTYAILRNLYGRIEHLLQLSETKKGGERNGRG